LDKNEINKLLGVLSNNGVYAMWVYAKSQKDINESELFKSYMGPILKLFNENIENLETFFQEISEDLHKLLFLKQLLEKTLIYARYHAKALEGGENE
jgi:hypothetical protein